VLVKLIGVFILLCCLAFSVFLIVAFVALLAFGNFGPFHDLPFGLLRHNHADFIYVSAFLIAFIPVLSIILLTLKGIFNTGTVSRSTGSTVLVIWLCSIGVFVYFATQIALNFRESARVSKTISLNPIKGNTYYLRLNDLKYFTPQDSARLNIKALSSNVKITEDPYGYNDFDYVNYRRVNINIEKGDVKQPVIIESFIAKGRDYDNAFYNVSNIKYTFTQQDTVLKFDYRLYAIRGDLFHDEELDITLKIPLNTKLVIDQDVNNMLDGLSVYDCKNLNKKDNATSAMFIMTDNGLQCKVDTLVTAKKDSVITSKKSDSTKAE
jgi:hypothetical protein